eukprot:TRINITY_DN7858_c0_g1_i1.p1 TRINITY_DN7858_c0_g1~~TRINITY_DN7858_c0_g1_i1.p1  ORF type:complete len:345 (-),score=103.38 TRINITY_DN7858_c0_g1_i1:118-1152(-)
MLKNIVSQSLIKNKNNFKYLNLKQNHKYLFSKSININTEKKKLGLAGCGIIGGGIASNYLKAGYEMTCYSRTRSKVEKLAELTYKDENGNEKPVKLNIVDTVKEVALNSDIIMSCVGFPSDVEQIALSDDGIINNLKSGSIYIDHTTSSPSLAKEIYNVGKSKNIHVIDAPVSGGDIGARTGNLVIFLGGDDNVISTLNPLFDIIGKNYKRFGNAGSGQYCKMANQIVIASSMIGVVEGMLYAEKAGLEVDQVIDLLSGGAASSFSLTAYGPRILKDDYEPGFFIEHFCKDLRISLESAKEMGLNNLPGLELASKLYHSLIDNNMGSKGTQALMIAIRNLNNNN